jgi:endonuclease YncB( thermonuclease family)
MVDPVQIFWPSHGITMPSLGTQKFIDIHDGDTPSIRMPVRMLSIDTPETTARSEQGAQRKDANLAQLAEWIQQRPTDVPISRPLAEFLLPKIMTGKAGTLQFTQGTGAAAFAESNMEQRLAKRNGERRTLFIRTTEAHFDENGRLLAYLAPNYTKAERDAMTLEQRSTFNLDMIRAGWAAPFVLYPSIPGDSDLPLFLRTAAEAVGAGREIWGNPLTLLGYEYRMLEKLHGIAHKIIVDQKPPADRRGWRQRYCVDMRTRVLVGPEDYFEIDPVYRLWIWPAEVRDAVAKLNLTPSPRLAGGD